MLTLRVQPRVPTPSFFGPEFDRMIEGIFNAPLPTAATAATPALNVWEDADNFYIEAELPGVRLEDLSLSLTEGELVINGRRSGPSADGTYHRRERAGGEFSRSLRVGATVDADNVSATLENGVLTLTLPKAASAKPRKIAVTVK